MAKQMMAGVMQGTRDLQIESRPVPEPGPGDALVRIKRCGVCGSDIHYYMHGAIGDFVVRDPMILGHECAGVVEAVGSEVTHLSPGDRVAIEPGHTCGKCAYCKTGNYNLCPDVVFMATPPVDGAFCEYVAWPADFVYPLPDEMSFEEGTLMEPLSVGIWATMRRGEVKPGASIAVFGSGPIGCCVLQAARVAGASTLIAVDLDDYKLNFARQFGATHAINAREEDPLVRIDEIVKGTTGLFAAYGGVDIAFETAGALAATRGALAATRRGGVAVLVGLPPEPMVELDIVGAAIKEIDIRGEFRYANCYPPAISLVSSGQVKVDALVTHHYPLAGAAEALEFAHEAKGESMKVMIDICDD